ncbi:MAG: hypothetical protein A2151_07340 [Candidatus Muproteobacteria bacterium RBG_16_65_34]|uniref:Restriction endonuclease type IV Mrr domain-containing protein n=1 Tax=Candidatus Muproteobacteria bacterium RBG_16_65_34 TaxID=1817760 RepID=A0A1F6TUF0_9PROT|nr:MAG: hypothetical protein A2151_07340 [Candidatus Muproteobacteria bacterium RBG_16_65_34]
MQKLKKQAETAKAVAVAAKRKEQETRAKTKQKIDAAKKEAALAEHRKTAIRDKRMMARIKKLEEEKKMLQKHTSPQEIGLADESVLVRKLRKEFPDDQIEHAGKGGDVLHYVMLDKEKAGCIVYECKRTDRIASDHVDQTALAKKTRHADYGILVTTGTRKRFSGLDQDAGIFIVAQSGVLTLARICRDSLVAMAKQRLDAAAKAAAAKRLMDYVTSSVCKTPLEEAISHTERAQKNLVKEMNQHRRDWEERHEVYQTIHYDVSHVQRNLARVLGDKDPLKLEKPKFEPLALPLKSDRP